jgi:hypothetical protein
MKYFLVLLGICGLLSCGSKTPPGIIPPPQMETILWQLMQTDEFTSDAFTRDSTKNLTTERIKRYRQVFELNQTNKEAFGKSYDYYMAHPDIAKQMFDSISARSTRLREALDSAATHVILTKPPSLDKANKLIVKPATK